MTHATRTPFIIKKKELNKVLADPPEGEAPDPVDTEEILRKLEDLQVEREAYEAKKGAVQESAREKSGLFAAVEGCERRAAELTRELEEEKDRLIKSEAGFAEAEKLNTELMRAFQQTEDPQPAILELQMVLASATEVLKSREPWERFDQAKLEAERVSSEESRLTKELKEQKSEEVKLLDEAGIPVKGIGFDEEGNPQLNGRSLAVASGRERIEVAVTVALAADPEIRVCLVDEANDLDLEALESLDALAKEHQFQIWVVRIGLEGDGEIVCEDGVAKDREEQVAK